jgi:predicted HAD superfamily Cof-like phosphohydrolase
MSLFSDIEAFHEKFELTESGPPRLPSDELGKFRVVCLREEVQEFEDALEAEDLEGAFDALIDLVYFALGTAHVMGLPFQDGWDRVQAANMKKIRAERPSDSKRGSGFDVVKPIGWQPPDLSDLVQK